jgi:putative DNA primase/helicase
MIDAIEYTAWRALTDPVGTLARGTPWCAAPVVVAAREQAPGWSPAVFRDDRRAKDRVLRVTALVFDYDQGTPRLDAAYRFWRRYACHLHPTWRHTPKHHRFRVVVGVSRSMTPAEHEVVWDAVAAAARAEGHVLDASTRDPSRYWFVPAAPAPAPAAGRGAPGPVVDVDAVLAAARAKPKTPTTPKRAPPRQAPRTGASTERATKYTLAALEKACDAVRTAPEGTRNATLNREGYALAGLVASGALDDAAYDALAEAARAAGLGEQEIRATLGSAIGAGERAPREIPAPAYQARAQATDAAPAPPPADPSDPGPVEPEADAHADHWTFEYTDVLNAEAFVRDHGATLRYCPERDWLRWDGARWVHDPLAPDGPAQQTARRLAAQVIAEGGENPGRLVGRLLKSQSVAAMVHLARPHVAVRIGAFDTDPWLFNVANGTLDLRTGVPLPHDPARLLTKLAPVAYDPAATCPQWDAFLRRVVPDPEVRAYLQRWAGYALTGVVREHVLPIFWGDGGNGKGTFCETLLFVLGDYASPIPVGVLMERDQEQHPTERAQLLGLRLAVASETKEHRSLDEATVKLLTGGDTIKARFMRQDFFAFRPTHKLALMTNPRPRLKGSDYGIQRRVQLVPWTETIGPDECDPTLPEKLQAEGPGILLWALRGCLAWQREGLNPPTVVLAATAALHAEADLVGRFVKACCRVLPEASIGATPLYEAFQRWCRDEGRTAPTQTAFGLTIKSKIPITEKRGAKCRMYVGVGLMPEESWGGE